MKIQAQRVFVALGGFLIMGCAKEASQATPSPVAPDVVVLKAQKRDIFRTVGQPGFVEAYEQSSIFPKITGFIKTWNVDIGDKVKKDQLLATLFVPELLEELRLKKAKVAFDIVLVKQTEKLVEVAKANLKAAIAKVTQSKAVVGKYQAEVDRWQSEVKRLTELVAQRVVDRQILDESIRQLRSNEAGRDASLAAVIVSEADQLSFDASVSKAQIDVLAALAKVKVSDADESRLAALVGYITLTSPYEGIVVLRNANTGDFVQASTGDQTAALMSPDQSTSRGAPLFAIARTDVVRIFVDVPEMDANYVTTGTKAEVRVQAFNDLRIQAKVTRTSWALNRQSRTLRAEIDLANPDSKLLPGMYAYGYIKIERSGVNAIPSFCITKRGDQTVCYLLKDNKAIQANLKLGISDGDWQEIVGIEKDSLWAPLSGDESFLQGDMDELSNGIEVKVITRTEK